MSPVVRMESYVDSTGAVGGRAAWAVVDVGPSRWLGTLPVHELLDRCDGHEVHLHGLPHDVYGDELSVVLGPARVRGGVDAWRALGERLLASPHTTVELLEAPAGRPWHGPATDVPVTSVEVAHEQLMPAERLARAGGFDLDRFVELFGSHWEEHPVEPGRGPGELDGLRLDGHERLYLWGQPPQLALGLGLDGLVLGRVEARWTSHTLRYALSDGLGVTAAMPDDDVRGLVQGHLRRRRRSFSWCRFCGTQLAPEGRFDRTVCFGCATDHFGVVY